MATSTSTSTATTTAMAGVVRRPRAHSTDRASEERAVVNNEEVGRIIPLKLFVLHKFQYWERL